MYGRPQTTAPRSIIRATFGSAATAAPKRMRTPPVQAVDEAQPFPVKRRPKSKLEPLADAGQAGLPQLGGLLAVGVAQPLPLLGLDGQLAGLALELGGGDDPALKQLAAHARADAGAEDGVLAQSQVDAELPAWVRTGEDHMELETRGRLSRGAWA